MSEPRKYKMNRTPLRDITWENICGNLDVAAVSFWAPRREEIQRFVEIAKSVHVGKGRPRILDVGCGTGFLAYLLAETGEVNVIGLDPEESLINNNPYLHPNLQLEVGDSMDAVKRYKTQDLDIVINSWMPGGLNLTPDIRDIGAKAIIYIREIQATGIPEYKYKEFFYEEGFDKWHNDAEQHRIANPISPEDGISYHPGRDYQRVFGWSGPACSEVQNLVRKMKDQSFYLGTDSDLNIIDIQFKRNIPIPEIPRINIPDSNKYVWELDLERSKGPVNNMVALKRFHS